LDAAVSQRDSQLAPGEKLPLTV